MPLPDSLQRIQLGRIAHLQGQGTLAQVAQVVVGQHHLRQVDALALAAEFQPTADRGKTTADRQFRPLIAILAGGAE